MKVKTKVINEYVIETQGVNCPINDRDMSTICIFNGGACIITMYGQSGKHGVDSPAFDIPDGVCTNIPYREGKELLLNIQYHPVDNQNTQNLVKEYDNGTIKIGATAIVEYYEPDAPEVAIKLFDENHNLI